MAKRKGGNSVILEEEEVPKRGDFLVSVGAGAFRLSDDLSRLADEEFSPEIFEKTAEGETICSSSYAFVKASKSSNSSKITRRLTL